MPDFGGGLRVRGLPARAGGGHRRHATWRECARRDAHRIGKIALLPNSGSRSYGTGGICAGWSTKKAPARRVRRGFGPAVIWLSSIPVNLRIGKNPPISEMGCPGNPHRIEARREGHVPAQLTNPKGYPRHPRRQSPPCPRPTHDTARRCLRRDLPIAFHGGSFRNWPSAELIITP